MDDVMLQEWGLVDGVRRKWETEMVADQWGNGIFQKATTVTGVGADGKDKWGRGLYLAGMSYSDCGRLKEWMLLEHVIFQEELW